MVNRIAANLKARRKQRGLTQQQLADATDLSRVSVANYERAKTQPDSQSLARLARALRVSTDLLLAEPIVAAGFRYRSDSSFRDDPATLGDIAEWNNAYTELERLSQCLPYAPESVPCDRLGEHAALVRDVASGVRRRLGLGEEPITDLFAILDRIGLKHIRTKIALRGLFGVSACTDDAGAFILVNTNGINVERQLFTAAHELGHLVFHRKDFGVAPDLSRDEVKEREAVANFFAGHLLVPGVALRRELEQPASPDFVSRVIRLKRHFRVSYLTILRRMSQDTGGDHTDLIKTFRWRWKRRMGESLEKHREPEPLREEDFPANTRFRNLVKEAYVAERITTSRAAELLGISVMRLRSAAARWRDDE